jgi:hypothetical protein
MVQVNLEFSSLRLKLSIRLESSPKRREEMICFAFTKMKLSHLWCRAIGVGWVEGGGGGGSSYGGGCDFGSYISLSGTEVFLSHHTTSAMRTN